MKSPQKCEEGSGDIQPVLGTLVEIVHLCIAGQMERQESYAYYNLEHQPLG